MSKERIVKCPICGKEFLTSERNIKYCGLVCAAAGKKRNRHKWEKQNPDYARAYRERKRAESAEAAN